MSLQGLRQVIAYLRDREGLDNPLSSTLLCSDGKDVYEKKAGELTSLLKNPQQGCFLFVMDLQRMVEEVKEEIKELVA